MNLCYKLDRWPLRATTACGAVMCFILIYAFALFFVDPARTNPGHEEVVRGYLMSNLFVTTSFIAIFLTFIYLFTDYLAVSRVERDAQFERKLSARVIAFVIILILLCVFNIAQAFGVTPTETVNCSEVGLFTIATIFVIASQMCSEQVIWVQLLSWAALLGIAGLIFANLFRFGMNLRKPKK